MLSLYGLGSNCDGITPAIERIYVLLLWYHIQKDAVTRKAIPGNYRINVTDPKLKYMQSCRMERGRKKWKNCNTGKGGQQQDVLRKLQVWKKLIKKVYIQTDHVADDDLESSDLFVWHMQSGHGKVYIESLGLLSSNPFESLWDRIFNIWRLKLFHLGTKQRKKGRYTSDSVTSIYGKLGAL